MTPEQARAATEDWASRNILGVGNLIVGELDADLLWAFAIGGRPAEQANPLAFLRVLPPRKPLPKPKRRRAPAPPPAPLPPKPIKPTLGTKSAERLLRALLRRRPRSEVDIRAAVAVASISARTLEAAANRLGVQTAGGQWRLPR